MKPLKQLTRTATYCTAAGVRHSNKHVMKNYDSCFKCLLEIEDRGKMIDLALRLQRSDISFLSSAEKQKIREMFAPTKAEIKIKSAERRARHQAMESPSYQKNLAWEIKRMTNSSGFMPPLNGGY